MIEELYAARNRSENELLSANSPLRYHSRGKTGSAAQADRIEIVRERDKLISLEDTVSSLAAIHQSSCS